MSFFSGLFGNSGPDFTALLEKGAAIIDVRTPGEFQSGHVQGSINIPVDQIQEQLPKIKNMKKPLVLCCASGGRSGSATRFLEQQGIECANGGSWTNVRAALAKK